MDISETFTQILQYFLGVIPGDIASDIIMILTALVTFCTVIVRFWKTEPSNDKKILSFLWNVIHTFAKLKVTRKEKTDADKTSQ